MKDSMEVRAVDPLKWLSKSTLKDFEPDSLVYESRDCLFETKGLQSKLGTVWVKLN